MTRIIIDLLKNVGFESVETKALELLKSVFTDRVDAYLHTISRLSIQSSRSSVSLLDLLGVKQKIPRIGKEIQFTNEMLIECNATISYSKIKPIQQLFTLVFGKKQNFENEIKEETVEWISPLSSRVEKFIHIYDFMPSFPPIHTFRMTLTKGSGFKNQSSKVKNRLEQSLRSENNMVKLIKSSGSMPKFINYLYKGKN